MVTLFPPGLNTDFSKAETSRFSEALALIVRRYVACGMVVGGV